MADMVEMEMPLPDNTLPMMTGQGPFGSIAMGGMFTTVKVRKGLARNDYKDPGWYVHPAGTQAHERAVKRPKFNARKWSPWKVGHYRYDLSMSEREIHMQPIKRAALAFAAVAAVASPMLGFAHGASDAAATRQRNSP